MPPAENGFGKGGSPCLCKCVPQCAADGGASAIAEDLIPIHSNANRVVSGKRPELPSRLR